MLARTEAVAKRVGLADESERINRLYQLVLGRMPDRIETEECRQFLISGSLDQLAQVLLMTNELMFVD